MSPSVRLSRAAILGWPARVVAMSPGVRLYLLCLCYCCVFVVLKLPPIVMQHVLDMILEKKAQSFYYVRRSLFMSFLRHYVYISKKQTCFQNQIF
jgi:hypothetical protein